MKHRIVVFAAVLFTLAACGGASSTGPSATSGSSTVSSPRPTVSSATGTMVGSIVVLKNYFFNNYNDENCTGWSITGSTADFTTYGECADSNTHFWLFSDAEQRDAYVDEIQAKNLPLLVSDEWIIASPIDLEPAQQDIGGAINEP